MVGITDLVDVCLRAGGLLDLTGLPVGWLDGWYHRSRRCLLARWRIAGLYRPASWLVGWLVSPISSMSACALAGLKRSLFGSRRSLVFLYSPIGTHAHVGSWRYYVCTYSPFPLAVRLSQGKERNKEARSSDRQRCRVSDSPCCTATQIPRKHLWIRLIHATGAKKLPICAT